MISSCLDQILSLPSYRIRLTLVCLFTYSQIITLSFLGVEVLILGKALLPCYTLHCKHNIWLRD